MVAFSGVKDFSVNICLAAWCILVSSLAQAGSYGIKPVSLTLSRQNSTQILTVRNDSQQEAVMQVDVAEWSQVGDREIYTPTRDLLATPPVFYLPAGASQIIRVGLRVAADEQRELAYRMFIQEVPPPLKPGNQGLQMALRISVPVWVAPSQSVKPDLLWKAGKTDNHSFKLSVTNNGNIHAHLSALKIDRVGSAEPIFVRKIFAYVLPQATRSWLFKSADQIDAGTLLHIQADVSSGKIQTEVVMTSLPQAEGGQ